MIDLRALRADLAGHPDDVLTLVVSCESPSRRLQEVELKIDLERRLFAAGCFLGSPITWVAGPENEAHLHLKPASWHTDDRWAQATALVTELERVLGDSGIDVSAVELGNADCDDLNMSFGATGDLGSLRDWILWIVVTDPAFGALDLEALRPMLAARADLAPAVYSPGYLGASPWPDLGPAEIDALATRVLEWQRCGWDAKSLFIGGSTSWRGLVSGSGLIAVVLSGDTRESAVAELLAALPPVAYAVAERPQDRRDRTLVGEGRFFVYRMSRDPLGYAPGGSRAMMAVRRPGSGAIADGRLHLVRSIHEEAFTRRDWKRRQAIAEDRWLVRT